MMEHVDTEKEITAAEDELIRIIMRGEEQTPQYFVALCRLEKARRRATDSQVLHEPIIHDWKDRHAVNRFRAPTETSDRGWGRYTAALFHEGRRAS